MKTFCNSCGCHFPEDFPQTLSKNCAFWESHGLEKLSQNHLTSIWSWLFALPIDEIALTDKVNISFSITGTPVVGEVNQFAETVTGYKEWDDATRKAYQKKLFMKKQHDLKLELNKIKLIKKKLWNQEVVQKIFLAGIESVKKHETDDAIIAGSIRGFEIFGRCTNMYELEQRLFTHIKRDGESYSARGNGRISDKQYTEYHCETEQLQYVFELMKVAYRNSGLYNTLSARAVIKFAEFFGIDKKKTGKKEDK